MNIANLPRKLSNSEYAKIKEHTYYGFQILNKIKGVSHNVLDVAKQHHERINRMGYPEHLGDSQINEYSQLISLCDVYEALSHSRAWRKQMESHEAIKEILILNSENYFDPDNIKILIKRIGLFPVGSWVELNSGEIGKVISANEDFPLRPNVNIIFDMNRNRYPELKSVALSKNQSIYIRRAVDLRDLGLRI